MGLPFGGPYAPDLPRALMGEGLARAAAVGSYLRALLKGRAESFAAGLYLQRHAPLTEEDRAEAARARDVARPARDGQTMPTRSRSHGVPQPQMLTGWLGAAPPEREERPRPVDNEGLRRRSAA